LSPIDRAQCERSDTDDPLRHCRDRFSLPDGITYLDGNSLGPLPKTAHDAISRCVSAEWGEGLISSWNEARWIDLPARAGDLLAPLIGARPDEIVFGDSTSVSLFKLAASLLASSHKGKKIVSETGNFPTDTYILEGLIRLLGDRHELFRAEMADVTAAIDDETSLVVLTHVNYRSGAMYPMARITEKCRSMDIPLIWDLCHSAGAVPLDLQDAGIEFAIGCGYKYLNGGPGAPAFTYIRASSQAAFDPVLTGWFSHARPFEFEPNYDPHQSIAKALVGTPPVIALTGLIEGLKTFENVEASEIRVKSLALSSLFMDLVDQELSAYNFKVVTPREADRRGSQVSLVHDQGYAIMQYLIAKGFIGDYREPGLLRFGLTPLFLRFTDIWDCIACLRDAMETGAWDLPEYRERKAVT
jgi:kynureninase